MRIRSLFWGLFLLMVGLLFLLENSGFIHVSVWGLIWPVFLIVLGIWIIAGRYIKRNLQDEFISISLEGCNQARFKIKHAAGKLNVYSGADPGFGLQGTFTGGLDLSSQHQRDCLEVRMKTPEIDFPFFIMPDHSLDWSFGLTKEIPLSLNFDTGANDAHLDLRDINVTDITLKTGASATEIILPSEARFTKVDVHSGAASLKFRIPQNVAANIRITGGLSSIQVDQNRFPKVIDGYRSLDYDTAVNKANLEIEMGVGSVIIE